MTLSCHLGAGCGRTLLGRFVRGAGIFFAALSSLLLITTAALKAAEITIVNGQTETNQNVTISTGDILTVLNGGTIQDNADHAVTATGNVTIDNAGTIVTTNGGSNGMFVNGSVGSLTNSGTITGGGDGVGVTSTIVSLINSGIINAMTFDGVQADIITSLINTGTIDGGGGGVDANSAIGSLINSGTINGGGGGGVAVVGTFGSLINSGTINADSGGIGVFVTGTMGRLINSGTINGAFDGVQVTTITSLINTGTINGGSGGDGVQVDIITSLINTGTINGGAEGVYASTSITSLINTGTINGVIDSGVNVSGTLSSLMNSGTITGGDNGVEATSLISLTNSGKITGNNFAIRETGTANSLLTLLPGSNISGAINLGGGVNTLVIGNGLSIDHVFATVPDAINSNGAPLFIISNRVVVVETSAFAQQDEQLFDLTSGIWGTVFNNIGDGRNPAAAFANRSLPQFSLGAVPPGETAGGYRTTHMWANLFGNHRIQGDDTPAASARHNLTGLITGLDGRLNSNTRLGAFFGASQTDIDTFTTQESEVENIFGGLYASFKAEGLTIDLGITGGISEHENTRLVDNNQVNGLETVSSSFDGTFIAPELSISGQHDMGRASLQSTLRVGYAGLFLDGYSETGSSAPLTVGDRDLHLLHARFELAALISSSGADSIGYTFSSYVGVEGRSLVSGEAVNVTLLGQNLSFNPGGDDDIVSAFAGVRLSVLQTENFGIFAGFEGSADTDDNKTITGNLGLKWQF